MCRERLQSLLDSLKDPGQIPAPPQGNRSRGRIHLMIALTAMRKTVNLHRAQAVALQNKRKYASARSAKVQHTDDRLAIHGFPQSIPSPTVANTRRWP